MQLLKIQQFADLSGAINPGGASGKEPDLRDQDSIPGLGRSPGEGHGNPFQYSCLEDTMEPGGLQSIGSHRVRHYSRDLARTQEHMDRNIQTAPVYKI